MAVYFFDTSALVKCYVTELGSVWVRQLCSARDPETKEKLNHVFISEIAIVEGAAALAILVRRGIISKPDGKDAYDRFLQDVEREYWVVHLTSDAIRRATELTQRYPLKAYDAMQLAVGLSTSDILKADEIEIGFVSSDNALLLAARAEGLAAENPHDHVEANTA